MSGRKQFNQKIPCYIYSLTQTKGNGFGFFIESIKKGQFEIGNTVTSLSTINPPIETEEYEQLLAYDRKIVQILDTLNIKEDINTNNLSADTKKDIEALVSVFVDNQNLSGLNVNVPSIMDIRLKDIYIKLIVFQRLKI